MNTTSKSLSNAEIEAFGRELDALREKVVADLAAGTSSTFAP